MRIHKEGYKIILIHIFYSDRFIHAGGLADTISLHSLLFLRRILHSLDLDNALLPLSAKKG